VGDVAAAVTSLLNFVGEFVARVVLALAPSGQFLFGSLAVLSIVFWGAAVWGGLSSVVPGAIRITGISTVTYWALAYWDQLSRGALDAARRAVGLLVPGYGGPGALFTLGTDVAERIIVEVGAAASLTSPSTWGPALANTFLAIIGWVCLVVVGIQAVLAEIELLMGATVAPLLLPFLVFGPTAGIGFGAFTWMVSAAIRVILLGLVSVLTADGIARFVVLDGTGGTLTLEQVLVVVALGIVALILSLNASELASSIARGTPGALGFGTVSRTAGGVAAATAAAAALGAGAARGGFATGKVAAAAARGAGAAVAQRGAATVGAVRRSVFGG
jgi:hypothetical protein